MYQYATIFLTVQMESEMEARFHELLPCQAASQRYGCLWASLSAEDSPLQTNNHC